MRKFLLMLCVLGSGLAMAQERVITGKVTSMDDESVLPGVNVAIQGTTRGTSTNENGEFRIEGVTDGASLVFSFVGFVSKTVAVGSKTVINVALESDSQVLEELVVVGYGVQKKSKLTSSISSINGKDLANLTTASVDQQLAGRAAGVQVTVGSGLVGQAPRIRVRGVNSITSGASPLIVIDGVPAIDGNQGGSTSIQTNPLADINPDDIESIEVLKDGAATAIYGSRAANGVVLVSTKKGSKGQAMKVTLGAQFGVTNAISRFDLLNAEQFVEIANEKIKNLNASAVNQAFLDPNKTDTDWQDVILRQGKAQNYTLGFSGGKDKTNYYFSLGYNDIQGAVVSSEQKRYSFTGNMDHNLNKVVTLGTKLQYTRTENSGLNSGSNSLSGNIANAARLFPNVPVYLDSHPTGYNISPDGSVLGAGANTRNIDNNYTNIQFVMDNNQHTAKINRILSASYVQLNLFDGFSLKSQLGIDIASTKRFFSWDPRHGDGRGANGVVNTSLRDVSRWNWQNTANYIKDVGNHSFNVTLGTEYQKEDVQNIRWKRK